MARSVHSAFAHASSETAGNAAERSLEAYGAFHGGQQCVVAVAGARSYEIFLVINTKNDNIN